MDDLYDELAQDQEVIGRLLHERDELRHAVEVLETESTNNRFEAENWEAIAQGWKNEFEKMQKAFGEVGLAALNMANAFKGVRDKLEWELGREANKVDHLYDCLYEAGNEKE